VTTDNRLGRYQRNDTVVRRFIHGDWYRFVRQTKRATLWLSADRRRIIKWYLPERLQIENTSLGTAVSARAACDGYELVTRLLPSAAILLNRDLERGYLELTHVEGTTLDAVSRPGSGLFRALFRTLRMWDEAGLYHNTITGSNIIVTAQGDVRLVDFDDVFPVSQLVVPVTNLLDFHRNAVHEFVLGSRPTHDDKLAYLEAVATEGRAFVGGDCPSLEELYTCTSSCALSVVTAVGVLLRLLSNIATGSFPREKWRTRIAMLFRALRDQHFDSGLALRYLTGFTSLYAPGLDQHRCALLNALFGFAGRPTVVVLADRVDERTWDILRMLDGSAGGGAAHMFVFSPGGAPDRMGSLFEELEVDVVTVEAELPKGKPVLLVLAVECPHLAPRRLGSMIYDSQTSDVPRLQVVDASRTG